MPLPPAVIIGGHASRDAGADVLFYTADARAGQQLTRGPPEKVMRFPDSNINALALSADGELIAVGGMKFCRVYRMTEQDVREEHRFESNNGNVIAVQFNGDARWILVAWEESVVKLFDLQSEERTTMNAPLKEIKLVTNTTAAILHPQEAHAVIADADGVVRFWDLQDGSWVSEVNPLDPGIPVRTLTVSQDAEFLVTGNYLGKLAVWKATQPDVAHGYAPRTPRSVMGDSPALSDAAENWSWEYAMALDAHETYITRVRFAPTPVSEPRMLASCSADETCIVWKASSPQHLGLVKHCTLDGGGGWVWDCEFTRDGRRLALGSSLGCVRLFDVASGSLCLELVTPGRTAVTAVVLLDPVEAAKEAPRESESDNE